MRAHEGLVTYLVFNLTWRWLESPFAGRESINETQKKPNVSESLREGSSFWCTGDSKSTRLCKFRYLCYHPVQDEYLFFHGPETVIDGVPDKRFDPALLDMSSVEDHNTQYFNYVDYPVHALESFSNITMFDDFSLIFHRFNPENIMHVVHDDLLPLYHTMRQFSQSKLSVDQEYIIVMMEGWNEGSYFDLYKLFTNRSLLLKTDLQKANHLMCFQHGIIGISKYTTWYQYGFNEPQGALPHVSLTGGYVRHFTKFIQRRFGLDDSSFHASESSYIVLCSREQNRLIINELDLSMAIARQLNKRVIRVSMATHSFKEQVELVSKASALIGMHGSILIMAMFLPPGAKLIELFPFGISPDNYTPYRTMVELPGMNILYASWRNEIEENTVTYPHEVPEDGGIDHLSEKEQEEIINTKEVPSHLCCTNPYWLYRIYQDTIVDIQSLLLVIESTENKQNILSARQEHKLYPSKVINVTCQPLQRRNSQSCSCHGNHL
ncbi:Protein O-linked-mannose beta-1,4-N-acetylglucosaminyltransferase 2 [Desmophyllum pertusum]|uniref:Protein O-linked-mannose beta-1,4-N-acetylglucosaminyltransferase 2 n=1 Tax=Desmophyllum pertusum TaxID=174260 RepID=A0A9W9ZPB3_9CNID|nr:Protein O-linked-mannose beta-1,4-N-acetylglucosaminyltransferase 2 [Desmophyllum pertusum]